MTRWALPYIQVVARRDDVGELARAGQAGVDARRLGNGRVVSTFRPAGASPTSGRREDYFGIWVERQNG